MAFEGEPAGKPNETDLQSLVCRVVCSVCKRRQTEAGDWVDDPDGLEDLDRGCISHGICPDCLASHYPEFK